MSDAFRKHLKSKGWTAIPFPSSEFRLLTLIWERNSARGHSNDFELLAPGVAPGVMPPEQISQIPDLSGAGTGKRDLSIGISILSGLVSALGGGTLGLKAAFKKESQVSFQYADLTGLAISPVALQMRMNQVAAPRHGLLADWLNDQLFVCTAVLLAKKIEVDVTDSSGKELGVDVPVLSNAIGGSVGVNSANSSNSKIEFTSNTPAPIGVRLFAVGTVRRGGVHFLDLVSTKQGQRVRSFGMSGEAEEGPAFSEDVELFESGTQGEDAPLQVTLDWEAV